MENMNMEDLKNMLSKMDKTQLEKSLSQVSQILNSPQADKLIEEIKKNNK